MYKHILIPIDDSELAEKAMKNGIAFARSVGARVTGFTAMPEYEVPSESAVMSRRPVVSIEEHERRSKKGAQARLRRLERRAKAAGVRCDTDFALSDAPGDAIIRAAGEHGCDLIFIASRGRGALGALVLGSQTQRVLAGSKIPTLIYR